MSPACLLTLHGVSLTHSPAALPDKPGLRPHKAGVRTHKAGVCVRLQSILSLQRVGESPTISCDGSVAPKMKTGTCDANRRLKTRLNDEDVR